LWVIAHAHGGNGSRHPAEHGRHLIRAATVPAATRRSFVGKSKHYRAAGRSRRATIVSTRGPLARAGQMRPRA
jgi:hypothetical protein